jgi:asparagine synthase (glutamine-hydrolysing)
MAPFTLFQHIEKLEPGHFLKISVHDFQIEKKYYSYLPVKNKDISENEALERYEDLLHKAIKRQLMADVPICVLLSGGVDSGLLTMIASKYYQGTFDTYTAGYDISDFSNELEDAQESACFFKTNHHDVIMKEKDFFPNFEKIINIIEEPLGSESIFPIFFLAEAITKDGYKVGLTGQGVDEPWGGYKRYSVQQLFDKYSFGPLYRFKGLSKFIKHEKYRRGVNSFLEKDKINKLIETYSIFDQRMIQQIDNGIFSPENQSALYDRLHEKIDLYHLQGMSQTDTMMMLDARMNLSDDLLLYTDKIAMHHSLELRVPYLDIELMQFVESIPAHMKVNLRNSKILHKKLSGKLLPDKIVNRNKKGFWTPRQLWFKSDAIDHIFEEMYETNSVFANYFNKNYVKNLIINHKAGKVNYEMQLYLLVILHYWFKLFGRG